VAWALASVPRLDYRGYADAKSQYMPFAGAVDSAHAVYSP
jgi:hypothetical protein